MFEIHKYCNDLKVIRHWLIALILLFVANTLNAQAKFTAKNTKGCTPLTVAFVDLSVGAVSWSWDLGNGNTSVLQNPSAIYYNPGKYTVKLIVTDSKGNKTTYTQTNFITAYKSPKANFTYTPSSICAGKSISFTENCTSGDTAITKYSWDMGDGTVLNTKNPVHIYNASGVFSVSLVVTDGHGCQDKIQLNKIIKVNPNPVAAFGIDSGYDCVVPTWIPFVNKSTGTGLTYTWYFGDGTNSNLKNPRHKYSSLGTYTVSLKVTDASGCTDSFAFVNGLYLGPLKADFLADQTIFCGPGLVNFDNKSTFNGGLKFEWDFGDGTKSSKAFPSHIYNNAGIYSVSLKVQSIFRSCSAQLTKSNYIRINPKPNGKIVLKDSFPCPIPFDIEATYVDTAKIKSIQWFAKVDMGSYTARYYLGNTNPLKTKIGNKAINDIVAVVTNEYGCTDSIVYENLQTNITSITPIGVLTGCVPFLFVGDMNVSTNRQIMGYGWDFGNNDVYYTKKVKRMFLDTGTFTVKAFVKIYKNCITERNFIVKVGMKTNPRFFTDRLGLICNNTDPIKFVNATKYPGFTIDSFRWVFDDSSNKSSVAMIKPWGKLPTPYTKTNVKHTYDRDTGWVVPHLISYHNGCPDTAFQVDSFKVVAAYAKVLYSYDICNTKKLYVTNVSSKYTKFKWFIDGKSYYTDSVELDPSKYHSVILRVWDDSSGCWDTVQPYFVTPPSPIGRITVLNSKLCAPGFASLSVDGFPANSVYWNINGKDTAWGRTAFNFKFDSAGIYKIKLIVNYTKYCKQYDSIVFDVGESNLKGSVTKPTTCLPADIVLTDSSYSSNKKHLWILSNGDTLRINSTNTKYTIQNSFKDTLWARLITEGTSICEPSTLIPIPIKGPGFKTRLIWEHTCSTSNLKGYIDKKRLSDVYMYSWDMGDGNKYTSQNINHKYADSGNYTVTVVVTDGSNCYAKQQYQVYFPGERLKVRVNYTTVGTKCPPMLVNFRDSSLSSNVSIRKWLWDFGDKSTSILQHPSHQYLNPGKYTISLTITDSLGCSNSKTFLYLILVPGPDGKFSFTPNKGCLPLFVSFSDSVNTQTAYKEWDYGDGMVVTGNNAIHKYSVPGKYMPALILKDSFGCKRIIRPTDTIFVFDNPQTQFTKQGLCLRDSIQFKSTSTCSDAPITMVKWGFLNENLSVMGDSVKHKFISKSNSVQLIVKSKNECFDTLKFGVKLTQPSVQITSNTSLVCLGQKWSANAKVFSDTAIQNSYWLFNGLPSQTGLTFNFVPQKSDIYHLQYFVSDKLGCWDTAQSEITIQVGDTVIPLDPTWRRVSVVNDVTHELVWKKYPSFDFSNYIVYADKGAGFVPINSLSNVTDTMIQIGGVDALHRSDCYKIASTNLCNFTQKEVSLNKHCTVELRGKSALNASILNWSSYVGWPVDRYVVYRQIGTSNFDSIGQVSGLALSYIDTSIKCYKVHHYRVKAYEFGGLNEFSWSDTCHVSPIYMNQVAPPEMKRATVLNDQYVRVEWQQLVKNKIPLERFVIVGKESKSSTFKNIWVLSAKSDSLVVNDKSFSVDNYSAIYKVLGIDECGDSSKFTLISQSILLDVSLTNQYYPLLQWNKYIEWSEGVKEYIVERNSGNGLVEIDRVASSDSNYIDPLPSLNCLPNLEYRITALRNKTVGVDSSWFNNSCSNVDDPGVKTKVFIPNAFTPNGNNLNELFKPEGIFIANYTMKIFNRWGEKIYEGQGCGSGWDGIYRSEIVPGGVYVYIVNVKGTDGKWYPFSGDVTVLR